MNARSPLALVLLAAALAPAAPAQTAPRLEKIWTLQARPLATTSSGSGNQPYLVEGKLLFDDSREDALVTGSRKPHCTVWVNGISTEVDVDGNFRVVTLLPSADEVRAVALDWNHRLKVSWDPSGQAAEARRYFSTHRPQAPRVLGAKVTEVEPVEPALFAGDRRLHRVSGYAAFPENQVGVDPVIVQVGGFTTQTPPWQDRSVEVRRGVSARSFQLLTFLPEGAGPDDVPVGIHADRPGQGSALAVRQAAEEYNWLEEPGQAIELVPLQGDWDSSLRVAQGRVAELGPGFERLAGSGRGHSVFLGETGTVPFRGAYRMLLPFAGTGESPSAYDWWSFAEPVQASYVLESAQGPAGETDDAAGAPDTGIFGFGGDHP